MDAKAVVNFTRGSARETANARANSPARNGSTFVTIMPIAVDCQSGRSGSRPATGASSACQRRARSGKIAVANTMHAIQSGRLDCESTFHTALRLVSFIVHHSSSALRTMPSAVRTPFFMPRYSPSASSSRS